MATVKTLFFNGIGVAGSIDIPASGWITQPDYCIFEWKGNPSEIDQPGYYVIRCIKIKQDVKYLAQYAKDSTMKAVDENESSYITFGNETIKVSGSGSRRWTDGGAQWQVTGIWL